MAQIQAIAAQEEFITPRWKSLLWRWYHICFYDLIRDNGYGEFREQWQQQQQLMGMAMKHKRTLNVNRQIEHWRWRELKKLCYSKTLQIHAPDQKLSHRVRCKHCLQLEITFKLTSGISLSKCKAIMRKSQLVHFSFYKATFDEEQI